MFSRATPRLVSSIQQAQIRGAAKGVKIETFSNDVLPYKGVSPARKPVKVSLETGKSYTWCACGLSKTQPFCDGTHNLNGITNARPITFQVEKTGEYYMCNCKQTDSRPLCDSNHKKVPVSHPSSSRMVAFGESPVYDGVAHKLGYKPKSGGFQ